jgi:phospholipase/lecithinase/hemolysin
MTLRTRAGKPRRLAWIGLLGLAVLGSSAQAGNISEIVAFGDSLSETGNTYIEVRYPPSPPYYQGHYSNGPIWLEDLADRLGIARPTPSLAGGTDNAWGGAETGDGTSFANTPNIGTQISAFLATKSIMSSDLITLWGGGNDFLNAGVTNPSLPVNNIIHEITALAHAGGTDFLVPNVPLLGNLPATNTLPQIQRDGLNALSQDFDIELHAKLNALAQTLGITIHQVDIEKLFQKIVKDPKAYGFTNVTTSALGDGVISGQGYLFWDSVHPTAPAGKLIADLAFGGLKETDASPGDWVVSSGIGGLGHSIVPEPSSIVLLLIAAPAGIFAARRRIRQPGRIV